MKFIKQNDRLGRAFGVIINKCNIESVSLEIGVRGVLLWFITNDYVHVIGHWSKEATSGHDYNWFQRWTCDKWSNDHTYCG